MSDVVTETRRGRVIEWFFPFLSAITAIAIFFMAQILSAVILIILDLDYEVYMGLCGFLYTIIALPPLILFAWVSKYFYRDRKSGLLLERTNAGWYVFAGFTAMGLLAVVTLYMFVMTLLSEDISIVANEMENYDSVVDRYYSISSDVVPAWDKVLNYVTTVLIVPVVEEIMFRGIILGQLLKRYNAFVAILISALMFGLMHGISIQIGYAIIGGLVIGGVYYITRNIKTTIMMHMIFNLFGSTLASILSDGWFDISEELSESILYDILIFELFCVIPTAVLFVVFTVIRSRRNRVKANPSQTEGASSVLSSDWVED